MSDSATVWTAAHQAPPSTGFSGQEYWSWLPFPSPGSRGAYRLNAPTLELKRPRFESEYHHLLGFPGGSEVKVSVWNVGDPGLIPGSGRSPGEGKIPWRRKDPLEKETATHSSTLAWRIPWREEPGRLQSMGSQRVGHN